jgi:integrase
VTIADKVSVKSSVVVPPDAPLRLAEAVKIAFPMGGMTVSGLRREIARQRLTVEVVANKQFVTLAAIEEMRKLCRVKAKAPVSGSGQNDETRLAPSPTPPLGSSSTPENSTPRNALKAMLQGLSERLDSTLPKSTSRRGRNKTSRTSTSPTSSESTSKIVTISSLTTSTRKNLARIDRLADFFGGKMLSATNRKLTNEYVKERGNKGGARRDLEDLRAAITHHSDEGFHRGIVKVKLPKKGPARDRWLTRDEAAKLLWKCWRAREVQNWKGIGPVETDKRPLRHLARFILIGLYSGTRSGAIASASPIPAIGRSYVDLENGVFYRLAQGKEETNKRQPPMRLAPRLLAHMRRWHRRGLIVRHFVEWNGEGVKSVKTGFKTAVGLAKLGDGVSPHTLRHTAATWMMQNATDPWQAAGYLGMSLETLLKTYGHHHPDHQKDAVDKIGARPNRSKSANLSPMKSPK